MPDTTEDQQAAARVSTMHVQMPNKLALGDNPSRNWKLFKQRLESYATLTELKSQPGARQQALFINLLEDDALELYNSFSVENGAILDNIISIFDSHIIKKTNITYERYKFNIRQQEEGEAIEAFISDIKLLIKTCEFCETCQESILRDKIVIGVNDPQLQKDL